MFIRFFILVHPELLVSNRYFVWRYSTDGRNKGHVIKNLTNAVAVDYDWIEQRVYISDVTSTSSRIIRVFFNGSGFEASCNSRVHVYTICIMLLSSHIPLVD